MKQATGALSSSERTVQRLFLATLAEEQTAGDSSVRREAKSRPLASQSHTDTSSLAGRVGVTATSHP